MGGLNPARGKIFLNCLDGAIGLGCGVNHSIPSSDEVKERVKLYFYTPFEPSRLDELYVSHFPVSLEQDTYEKGNRTTFLNYCVSGLLPSSLTAKRKKRFGIKSEKLRRLASLQLDLSNELRRTGASPYFVSRVENMQFPTHRGLLEAAC